MGEKPYQLNRRVIETNYRSLQGVANELDIAVAELLGDRRQAAICYAHGRHTFDEGEPLAPGVIAIHYIVDERSDHYVAKDVCSRCSTVKFTKLTKDTLTELRNPTYDHPGNYRFRASDGWTMARKDLRPVIVYDKLERRLQQANRALNGPVVRSIAAG